MFSIIIPALNEEKSISDTISRCLKVILERGNAESEVLVVDDGSHDETALKAKLAGASIIQHPHNIGYGKALKSGISNAKNDTIIITDSDGTYPIESMPDLLNEYGKGFDMVVGKRTGKYYHESVFKKFNRFILKSLVEFTAGRKIPDINSGLRIFSKRTILPYFHTLCNTFSFTTSLTLAYMMTGKFVRYLPISYNRRIGDSKVRLLKDSVRTMQYIVEAILYYNPIKIYIVFSIFLLIISITSFIITFFTKIKITYFLGVGALFLTILMFGIGLLSIQLKQIITHVNDKQNKL